MHRLFVMYSVISSCVLGTNHSGCGMAACTSFCSAYTAGASSGVQQRSVTGTGGQAG